MDHRAECGVKYHEITRRSCALWRCGCGLQGNDLQVSSCFKEALKTIEENGVKVSTISTDRHPQIVKEMRVCNPEKHHEFDPWHVARGVSKQLATAAKRRECEGLGEWIPSL